MLPSLGAATAVLALLIAAPTHAFAQSEEGETKPGDSTDEKSSDEAAGEKSGDAEGDEPKPKGDPKDEAVEADPAADGDKHSPYESPSKRYNFIGLRFRDVIVPKAIINLFAKGGATVNVFTFGPEFATRKDGLEIDVALSYADYSMNPFVFKGKNDNDTAWERVESSLKLVYATIDLLWDVPLDKRGKFSLLVGGGIGIGAVFGDLKRNQVRPRDGVTLSAANEEDNETWVNCAPEEKGPDGSFCDSTNDHYGDYKEPSWANGGSKPMVYPWLAIPHVAFRYKPIKELATRADVGFNLFSGFYFGVSAAYGL